MQKRLNKKNIKYINSIRKTYYDLTKNRFIKKINSVCKNFKK